MKKLLVFFIAIVFLFAVLNCSNLNAAKVYATEKHAFASFENRTFKLNLDCNDCSLIRTKINNLDVQGQIEAVCKIMDMGFNLQQALCYVFPNLEHSINNVCNSLLINPQEPMVIADNNNCKIIFKDAKNGVKVDKNALFCDFFNSLVNNLPINVKTLQISTTETLDNLKQKFVLVSRFETTFANSSVARKNNISLAASAINGKFIRSNQTFSFNSATGPRSEANGYKSAKIIENGGYVEGFGGGVCQVSSTLYNACILAGLTATEVHNHSLPTSYVDPAFDAMVNMGTSDLKIKNNTANDYLITTSTSNDKCCVCIYGIKPAYIIKARYEKYEEIPAGEDILVTDNSKYNNAYGQGTHRISYGINGYKAKGYLDYYKDGVLVKSELIRDNTYKARQGVVLVV